MLNDLVVQDLRTFQKSLTSDGTLLSKAQLQSYYDTFKGRFGPERLKSLDGETLLETMHNHSNHDSLVYWLEFKNDDELPANFGSIAGGSALKFGIFRRRETGAWTGGSPLNQKELSLTEAIQIAKMHRDQLIRGTELLEKFPTQASDANYEALQQDMGEQAPDVSDSAWGHKYFSMLYPDKLDDYHNPNYQRFHLIKMLQVPPVGDGRYRVAGRYVSLANELGMPINHLTTILNHRDGNPHRYWRVLASYTLPGWENSWQFMRQGGYIAIGWADLGDLSGIELKKESKEQVRSLMKEHYADQGRWAAEVFNFVAAIQEGDVVLAFEKSTVLGIGKVTGPYEYAPATPKYPHHRAVNWFSDSTWQLPEAEALSKTIGEISGHRNLVEVERRVLGATPIPVTTPRNISVSAKPSVPRLAGVLGRIQSILDRKGQVILYGPPGTGKTYWAVTAARELAAYGKFGRAFDQLSPEQKALILGDQEYPDGLVRTCSFHPAYGYEDFLEGYRPVTLNNQLAFEKRSGIFVQLCEDARSNPDDRYYLIIDEINRGDIPRIFGELLTVLEKDKRGTTIILPLSGTRFHVPSNVYVLGTMNTADRSIALLDTALRRRFGFVEFMPDSSVFRNAQVGGIPLGPWLDALNHRLCEYVGRDARNLQIGHAYLLERGLPVSDFAKFARILQDDILPLLEEYCYEDYSALEKILGRTLIDVENQRIRYELFDASRQDDLVQSLLELCPEITASSQAMAEEPPDTEPGQEGNAADDEGNGQA